MLYEAFALFLEAGLNFADADSEHPTFG